RIRPAPARHEQRHCQDTQPPLVSFAPLHGFVKFLDLKPAPLSVTGEDGKRQLVGSRVPTCRAFGYPNAHRKSKLFKRDTLNREYAREIKTTILFSGENTNKTGFQDGPIALTFTAALLFAPPHAELPSPFQLPQF